MYNYIKKGFIMKNPLLLKFKKSIDSKDFTAKESDLIMYILKKTQSIEDSLSELKKISRRVKENHLLDYSGFLNSDLYILSSGIINSIEDKDITSDDIVKLQN